MRSPVLPLALLVLTSAGTAHAQYNVPSQATGDSQRANVQIAYDTAGQVIAKKPDEGGYEYGASFDFLSRERALGESAYKFTDVVLFRAHGLLALGRTTELFGGVDLLPKQPSYTNELAWQGALLGVRKTLGRTWSAYARGAGGPGLGRDGYWTSGEAAAHAQVHLAEKVLFWESTLGGTYTRLFPDDTSRRDPWVSELMSSTGIALREKRGFFATWLTVGFAFPLASAGGLDPQTRVSMQMGILGGVTRSLDLFMEVQILDRGDLEDPATTLPILGGGFDQTRLVLGFNRRFGSRRH